jgi:hypothetical protein
MRLCDVPDKVALAEFLPELRMIANGVPSDIAEAYVRNAAIEFCERSAVVKREVFVDLQCDVQEYLLEPPDSDSMRTVSIDFICDARGQRHYLRPNQPCQLNCPCLCAGAWEGGPLQQTGTAPLQIAWLSLWFQQPNSLFVRSPVRADTQGALRVSLNVAPKRDACDLDRVLFDRYLMTLVAGAAGYLLMQPKQDWSNPQLAAKYERDFKIGQARGATDALIGESRGPFRATAQRVV